MRIPATFLRPGIWWASVSVWFVVLFFLSSQSKVPYTQFTFSDKIAHFGYFTLGSTAFYLALQFQNSPPRKTFIAFLTIAFAAAVGWFDEWHQSYTPGRSGLDVADWIADIAGGIFACFVGAFLFQRFQKRAKDVARPPNP